MNAPRVTCSCGGAVRWPPPEVCPHCGRRIASVRRSSSGWWWGVLVVIGFFVLLIFALQWLAAAGS